MGRAWQIVPTVLGQMITDPDKAKAKRVAEEMLKQVKFDVAKLEAAFQKSLNVTARLVRALGRPAAACASYGSPKRADEGRHARCASPSADARSIASKISHEHTRFRRAHKRYLVAWTGANATVELISGRGHWGG